MKNFSKIWLIPLLPIMIMVGCEKRLGITYPTTVTPGTPGTSTATRTITRTMIGTATQSPVVSATTTSTITGTATQSPVVSATTTSTITPTFTFTIVPTAAAAMPTVIGGIAQSTPVLGTSTLSTFVILSDQAITDVPDSAITGDVGIYPGARSSMTGGLETPGDPQINGTGGINAGGAYASYASDDLGTVNGGTTIADMLIAAKAAALTAYNDANATSRGTATSISGDLNGLTLAPGLYESLTSIQISPGGFLYLDGMGVVNATFIIRSSTSITTESTSNVVLTGGTLAKNVFWVAGSAITLGTNSFMSGTLIASTSISLLTGARLDGRALIQGSQAGQVSLDRNIVVKP